MWRDEGGWIVMPAYREGKAFVKAIEESVDRSQDRCRIRDCGKG